MWPGTRPMNCSSARKTKSATSRYAVARSSINYPVTSTRETTCSYPRGGETTCSSHLATKRLIKIMKAFVAALLCLAYASALPTNSMWVVSNPPAEDSGVKASFEKKTIPYPSDPLKEDEVCAL